MSKSSYKLTIGHLPILVSMPHNGSEIPPDVAGRMHDYALKSVDTDWYLDRLYAFAKDMGCYRIDPVYSRYLIDLNRPQDNQSLYPGADTTELCPTTQFDNRSIYRGGEAPTQSEVEQRVEDYWKPYHQALSQTLEQIVDKFGYAILFEAHSIASVVPRFFEGILPDLNFGTYNGASCSSELSSLIEAFQAEGYSSVVNQRFKGGYITRHYGQPDKRIDAVQLELSQATYMNEEDLSYNTEKANKVIAQLKELFKQLECLSRQLPR